MHNNPLIGLCGYAGAGKDTAAKGLIDQGWVRVSFADPLRQMALDINPEIVDWDGSEMVTVSELSRLVERNGWETTKRMYEPVRKFLQRLGTQAREYFGENVWVGKAIERIREIDRPVVITDARFPNEFEAIKRLGGVLVRINRPGCGPVNGHVSESYVESAPAECILENSQSESDIQFALAAAARTFFPDHVDTTCV